MIKINKFKFNLILRQPVDNEILAKKIISRIACEGGYTQLAAQ